MVEEDLRMKARAELGEWVKSPFEGYGFLSLFLPFKSVPQGHHKPDKNEKYSRYGKQPLD
jgi:hypothetical protein